jgi:protein-S-isoprenylcysteine O-methyltransferase Ste14
MLILAYGVLAYLMFLLTLLYAVGYLENFAVPRTVDIGPETSVGTAVLMNIALLGLFAVQHSVMARPAVKRWMGRLIPAPMERSTFVLAACTSLMLLFTQWRPITTALWHVETPALRMLLIGISTAGFAMTVYASFVMNHFELFGLRQVWLHYRGRQYTPPPFARHLLFSLVRHPLMLGFLVAFWVAPTMTVGRLMLAGISTVYILIATRLEERDMAAVLGEDYLAWRSRTPALIPGTQFIWRPSKLVPASIQSARGERETASV